MPIRVAIPAKVSFIATQAQFTPKTVETQDERDKLMFRIRVRIDPERLRGRGDAVRSGLPGVAYVRLDPDAEMAGEAAGFGNLIIKQVMAVAQSQNLLIALSAILTQQYGRGVALDDVTISSRRPHGRVHRAGRRRQIIAAQHPRGRTEESGSVMCSAAT